MDWLLKREGAHSVPVLAIGPAVPGNCRNCIGGGCRTDKAMVRGGLTEAAMKGESFPAFFRTKGRDNSDYTFKKLQRGRASDHDG